MKPIEVSVDYGGRVLTLQTGRLAKQADASVLATYGETVVLVAVVASKEIKENQDFFPLTVDFQEKYYAAGRIPGGFFKREAKPSDRATLSARLIDRPCRPLFPEDFLCETNVTVTVLSTDNVNEADIVASIAASTALHISDIPFNGPVATCRVGLVDGNAVINIPPAELPNSKCELLISGVRTGVVMVEGAAKEISEKEMIDAIDAAHTAMKPIFDMQDELREKAGKPKRDYVKPPRDKDLKASIRKEAWPKLEKAFAIREKLPRYEALAQIKKDLKTKFEIATPATKEEKARNGLISLYLEEAKSEFARELTLDKKHRIDGRKYNAIRPIACETGFLPRVHGSGLFTRGETQVLAAVTLGTSDDEQKIDSIYGSYQKSFMLHYNFPPFSVGEARPLRPPGRREVGHGFLAERALSYIIPPKEVFPYTIRLVSEVLESNGSSSMATVCSGSMALMDAGIPVPKPVAGVAMGLIKEGERYAVLSDILGDEDHLGDMDFKVCGTADGVTAFQMDLKIGGVSREIMEEALSQAREGRLHILEKMAEAISEPKSSFSPYAPRIFTIKVRPEKVREVIGSGGKVIRSIIERTGVKIDIEDDGSINIASADDASAQKAIDIINQIVAEPEIGKIYEGKVTRIADFGAFVEILPGTDGLCHISELEHFRVRRVEDVVKEGEIIKVKCLDVDSQG
ncbi:polyribonucleotide nucleotidyltransferase, partial [bacterium]|nr:polyribonucleotide nucleotidyltransferase [bacterium]